MRFDLTDLRLFLAVADTGSITHGAAEVGLSLPAASERLRDMEATGQVLLLERGRRGVALTEAGEALVHHARAVMRQMADLHSELGSHAKAMRTAIRVAANTATVTEYLPAKLAAWMAKNPRIDVELKERQSSDIARAILRGFVEIGILSDAVETTGLELVPFAIDQLVLITARSHPLAEHKRVSFSDILQEQFIGLSAGALQEHLEIQATRLGGRLKIRTKLRTFEGVGNMVAASVGVAIIPQTAARRLRKTLPIATVAISDAWARRNLAIAVQSLEELTTPARSLVDHLVLNAELPAIKTA
ncbi:LysR substrate-binding domain-containing protein [Brucella anthropi]|uniref:LysR substrate-binding domain-containing protein n=1 Tax=Brucella anthropi TaxID=529 RepID=UPI000F660B72|nr:LysR substrate-binding domain-containing protein [Brucella anthropi]RRY11681.1 LysR family transcriptional regulator [Brucella anthropi]